MAEEQYVLMQPEQRKVLKLNEDEQKVLVAEEQQVCYCRACLGLADSAFAGLGVPFRPVPGLMDSSPNANPHLTIYHHIVPARPSSPTCRSASSLRSSDESLNGGFLLRRSQSTGALPIADVSQYGFLPCLSEPETGKPLVVGGIVKPIPQKPSCVPAPTVTVQDHEMGEEETTLDQEVSSITQNMASFCFTGKKYEEAYKSFRPTRFPSNQNDDSIEMEGKSNVGVVESEEHCVAVNQQNFVHVQLVSGSEVDFKKVLLPEIEVDDYSDDMTSPRSKSPRPGTPRKDEKDESFWDKLGTLGRKKRIKELQEAALIEQEGKDAIDLPGSPMHFDIPPEDYDLAEGEERSLIERKSYNDPRLQHLINLLIDWMNDELADQRIIVKNIEDDLYDGQILQKLLEKLTGQKLEVPEVSQSEEGQRAKLEVVLNTATHVMGLPRWNPQKWSVESIHSKSLVAILYLLVTLARHFRAPLRLPENVNVETVVVRKKGGKLDYRRVTEEITSTYDEFGMRCERDAFDALLDHASDKLPVVKTSLKTFVNKHLNKINLDVTDIETQFHDGVYLILLMGLLQDYFVPLFEFHLTPKDFDQKVFNVSFAFELMQDAGLSKPKARPEDIVNLDLKSTLRVLYNLFYKYKNLN